MGFDGRLRGEAWGLGIGDVGAHIRSDSQGTVWGLESRELSVGYGVRMVCQESGV